MSKSAGKPAQMSGLNSGPRHGRCRALPGGAASKLYDVAWARFPQNRKSIIGWDEILQGGGMKDVTVMSWRGEEGGIASPPKRPRRHHHRIALPLFRLRAEPRRGRTALRGRIHSGPEGLRPRPLPANLLRSDAGETHRRAGPNIADDAAIPWNTWSFRVSTPWRKSNGPTENTRITPASSNA